MSRNLRKAGGSLRAGFAAACRRSQFGSFGAIGFSLSLSPQEKRHHKADTSAKPLTFSPDFRRSAAEGRMNFGWRFEPSKQRRWIVSAIFGLANRRAT